MQKIFSQVKSHEIATIYWWLLYIEYHVVVILYWWFLNKQKATSFTKTVKFFPSKYACQSFLEVTHCYHAYCEDNINRKNIFFLALDASFECCLIFFALDASFECCLILTMYFLQISKYTNLLFQFSYNNPKKIEKKRLLMKWEV